MINNWVEIMPSERVQTRSYNLRNCILCSYLLVEELRRSMKARPQEEQVNVRTNKCIEHNIAYYFDEYGHVSKYIILTEGEANE
jgi:hypothetical protein